MRGVWMAAAVATLLTTAWARPVHAQEAGSTEPLWFTLGVGPFRDYDPQNIAGPAPAALALMGHMSFSTRFGVLSGGVTTDVLDLDSNIDHAYALDLLYGWRVSPGGGVYAAASTGVSALHMQTFHGSLGTDRLYTVGLPVLVQITATSRNWGFGGQFYTSVNSHRSFFIVALAAQVGRLWETP